MNIMLGNLNINEIQSKTGVVFPDELIDFMSISHQESAKDIKNGKWHCFDIPFMLVCGDVETAKKIHSYLKDKAGEFKTPLEIGVCQ